MSFVHCHKCGWSQDDFWSKSYNPLKFAYENNEKYILDDLDKTTEFDPNTFSGIKSHIEITYREWMARDLERRANTIREMIYPTKEIFDQKNPGKKCPMCKESLCID
jgi:hypothetical protein